MTPGPRSKPPDLSNFRHLDYLGGGGFADVFLYEQLRPRRQVAIKVLRSASLPASATRAFDDALKAALRDDIAVVELDVNINDPEFSRLAAETLLKNMASKPKPV